MQEPLFVQDMLKLKHMVPGYYRADIVASLISIGIIIVAHLPPPPDRFICLLSLQLEARWVVLLAIFRVKVGPCVP